MTPGLVWFGVAMVLAVLLATAINGNRHLAARVRYWRRRALAAEGDLLAVRRKDVEAADLAAWEAEMEDWG